MISSDSRDPMRGNDWKRKTSAPTPMVPLIQKSGKESPESPWPKVCAQRASNGVATASRQKLASVPPSRRAERVAQTTESDQRMVVINAASTKSKRRFCELPPGEPAPLPAADRPRQFHRCRKIAAHLRRRVGVGAEGDGDLAAGGQFQKGAAGVNFAAILAQPGRVQLDGHVGFGGAVQEPFEERRAILRGVNFEFFRQIRVADDLEKPGFRRLSQPVEINRPDLKWVASFPIERSPPDYPPPRNRRRNGPSR